MEYADILQTWNVAMSYLKENLPPSSYSTWFQNLQLHTAKDGVLIAYTNDGFVRKTLKQRYMTLIANAVLVAFGEPHDVKILLEEELGTYDETPDAPTLNPKYTFERFVVGNSNRFAHAAALAVADSPAEAYNPLFLYSGVGLGKTHLMNAIAHRIRQNAPQKQILFMTSEQFTNEVIDAIAHKKTQELRNRMRNVDVLIVDDLQFLSNKTATQEEFFHTFNSLFENHKQIILSSDRPPNAISTLEERLKSRCMSGLIADMQRPDLETRMAILKQHAADEGIPVRLDVLNYIAEHVDTNIRELEGSLNRIHAFATLEQRPITVAMAENALQSLVQPQNASSDLPDKIIELVSSYYGLAPDDLYSSKRAKEITLARQVAMYLMHELTPLSTVRIGKVFGGRDHTTVMHSCEKISSLIFNNSEFRQKIDGLYDQILNNKEG